MSMRYVYVPRREYTYVNVPQYLLGKMYIGSRTWPVAGTWQIHYTAPVILYVFAGRDQYNGGIDDFCASNGWTQEDAGNFVRAPDLFPLTVWSKVFTTGTDTSISTNGMMNGGVIG